MSDMWEQINEALDSDPLAVRDIVRDALAEKNAEIKRLSREVVDLRDEVATMTADRDAKHHEAAEHAVARDGAELRAEDAEAERERLRSTALDLVTSVQAERDELLAERDQFRALVVRMAGATLAMQTHGRTSGNATLVGFAQRLREMLPDIGPDGSTTWPSMAYPVCTNCGAPTTAQNALCQPCRRDAAPDQPEETP